MVAVPAIPAIPTETVSNQKKDSVTKKSLDSIAFVNRFFDYLFIFVVQAQGLFYLAIVLFIIFIICASFLR